MPAHVISWSIQFSLNSRHVLCSLYCTQHKWSFRSQMNISVAKITTKLFFFSFSFFFYFLLDAGRSLKRVRAVHIWTEISVLMRAERRTQNGVLYSFMLYSYTLCRYLCNELRFRFACTAFISSSKVERKVNEAKTKKNTLEVVTKICEAIPLGGHSLACVWVCACTSAFFTLFRFDSVSQTMAKGKQTHIHT